VNEVEWLIRLFKPLLVALVMAFSLFWITHNTGIALVGMLLPLVLGLINIGTGLAYGITALTFLVAVAFALTPLGVKRDVALIMHEAISQVKELSASAENPVNPQAAQAPDQTPGSSHTKVQ
jgi:hypothetical protein